jgi:DNA-binding NarL/FixJ family response regulator
MSKKTKVLIVDDHSVVIEGIKTLLSGEANFEVVGSATDGRQALSLIKSMKPDVVILDISMPRLDGIDAAREIKQQDDKIGIIVYSMSGSKEHITGLFKQGVSAYVLKEEPLSELRSALNVVRDGATFYSKSVQEILREHIKKLELGPGKDVEYMRDGVAKLSVREKEVFVLLADGLIPKEIGKRLGVSPKTVETHKYNIMDKLGVNSVAQLTKIAVKKHLIDI